MRLSTYSGEGLQVLGTKMVQVKYEDQVNTLPLIVVEGTGVSLLGRNWLGSIRINWGAIKKLATPLDQLLDKYQELFQEELGTLKELDTGKDVQVCLSVRPGAQPTFCRHRSVPYALKGAIEQEIEKLEKEGVLEPVRYSEWATPLVAVTKADGGMRLCGDYKVTVNPSLEADKYPMPTPEDLFATLAGGKKFTKLDLSRAYQQVLLEPESRKYLTVSTHKGLFQYMRLPFGISPAPALFQQIMDKMIQGIPRVSASPTFKGGDGKIEAVWGKAEEE